MSESVLMSGLLSAVPAGLVLLAFRSRHLLRCVPGYYQSPLRA